MFQVPGDDSSFFLYNKKVRLVPRVAGENPEKNVRFLDKMSRIPRIWSVCGSTTYYYK